MVSHETNPQDTADLKLDFLSDLERLNTVVTVLNNLQELQLEQDGFKLLNRLESERFLLFSRLTHEREEYEMQDLVGNISQSEALKRNEREKTRRYSQISRRITGIRRTQLARKRKQEQRKASLQRIGIKVTVSHVSSLGSLLTKDTKNSGTNACHSKELSMPSFKL